MPSPTGTRREVGRPSGVDGLVSSPQVLGVELWAVAPADKRLSLVNTGEILQHLNNILGLATPFYPDGQADAVFLFEHIQQLRRRPSAVASN